MDDGTAGLIVFILTGITLPLLYFFIMNAIGL
jgi:hypothetical protein